jgi:hypothetical protein
MAVQTTTNQKPAATERTVQDAAPALKVKYEKGTTINDLALEYGYSEQDIEAAIVKPVLPEDIKLPTQAEIDAKER